VSKHSGLEDDDGNSVFAYSSHEKTRVHIGHQHQWDMSHRNNLQWTPLPEYPSPKRATPGIDHFEKQDYRCCSRKECGLQMKVAQGRVNSWYFAVEPGRRAGRWINNCSYSHSRGEGEHHNLVKHEIAKLLRNSPHKEEYKVGKIDVEIMRSKTEFPGTEVQENVIPDITIIHSIDSNENLRFTYIEIVDTHPIERNSHDCYGENVVIVNIANYRDDTEALQRFVDDKLAITLKKQFDIDVRRSEWEWRQEKFERKEKQLLENYIAKIIEDLYQKHGHHYPQFKKPTSEMFNTAEEVQEYFSNQLEKHKLMQEIEEMIETLSQKYRHNNILIKKPISEMFNSVEEVKEYFNREEEKEKKRIEEYDHNRAADIADKENMKAKI